MSKQNQTVVERYMAACSAADRTELLNVLAPEAIHYFSPKEMKPIRGAELIAQFWLDAQVVHPRWTIDNIVSQDDQVVVEYTNTYRNAKTSKTMLGRGSEWYRLKEHKITEIRAYFESDYSRDTGLTEYPYEEMGYTTKRADA
jgi:ketosteroid isomerase-like protein